MWLEYRVGAGSRQGRGGGRERGRERERERGRGGEKEKCTCIYSERYSFRYINYCPSVTIHAVMMMSGLISLHIPQPIIEVLVGEGGMPASNSV